MIGRALRAALAALVLVVVPGVGLVSCLAPSPEAAALAGELREARSRAEEVGKEAESRAKALEAELEVRLAELERVEQAGDLATADALRALVAQVQAQRDDQARAAGEARELAADLERREERVLAEDKGRQTGTILDLVEGLAGAVLGGGAVVGVAQRFGRSRSADALGQVREHLARVEGQLEAFEEGLAGGARKGGAK